MDLSKRAYSVLIVSAAEKFNTSFKEMCSDLKYDPLRVETSVSGAKRALLEREFDFVAVNAPLPDGDGVKFAIDACVGKSTVVLLLVRHELYHTVFERVSPFGVFALPKPTAKPVILQALDFMASSRERLRSLEKKAMTLEERMQEIRTINRAKWLLISELKMTEADAHHYIEKQAMDRCVSKKEIAQSVIKTYQ